jgi:hypothetical protein
MIDFAPNALRMGEIFRSAIRNPSVTCHDVQIPGLTAGASQAKACATILPNPTARNVETPVPGLTAGAGCERGAALQPAFSPARQGGVRLMDGLRAIPKASVADAAQRVILNRTQGRRQMSTKQRTPTRRRAGLETRAEID